MPQLPIALLVAPLLASGQVTLRGSTAPLPDPVIQVSGAGVALEGEQPRVLSWGVVKRIDGEKVGEAAPFLDVGEALWRASARLSRADASAAEPLFESAAIALAAARGQSLLHAVEGLAEARRRTGGSAGAIDPWLTALQLQREGVGLAGAGVEPILQIDGETGLCPGLAPMWAPGAELTLIADAPSFPSVSDPDAVVEALGALYERAALYEIDLIDESVPLEIDDRVAALPGIVIVRRIVLARSADPSTRQRMQNELREAIDESRGDESTSWLDAWRRLGLARSLLREDGADLREEALIHLSHLPARYGSSLPYLAGLGLAEMAVELSRRGSPAASERVMRELEDRYPWHPARVWMRGEIMRLELALQAGRGTEASTRP